MKIIYFLCVCFLLSACMPTYKFDLKAGSLIAVEKTDIKSHIGADIDLPIVVQRDNDYFLIVEVFTKENLVKLIDDFDANLSVNAYFCDRPTSVVSLSVGSIYFNGQDIVKINLSNALLNRDEGLSNEVLHRYEVALFLSSNLEKELPESFRRDKEQKNYLKYDLRSSPENVCLYFAGGNMIRGIKSSEIRLSKEEIQKVLPE